MERVKQFLSDYLYIWICLFVGIVCAVFLLAGKPAEDGTITLNAKPAEISEGTKAWEKAAEEVYIKYAEKAVPALLADGTYIDVPTVESIDGPAYSEEKCEEGEECGRGTYVYAPTETFQAFEDYTYGKCWNVDGYAGAQCWDLVSLHSMNYTQDQRVFSTCGTGAAKGMWACKEQNAGTEYDLIYNIADVQVGDIMVFGGGTWGHTGFAVGPYNNGYIALYGQNQGGAACAGGGAVANIINMSTATFLGAFRPKTYHPEPEPTPTPTPSGDRYVSKGDTMGGIMLEREGYVEWGQAMNNYANTWCSTVVMPGQSVYYGWTHNTGVGLYAGDTITRCNL